MQACHMSHNYLPYLVAVLSNIGMGLQQSQRSQQGWPVLLLMNQWYSAVRDQHMALHWQEGIETIQAGVCVASYVHVSSDM